MKKKIFFVLLLIFSLGVKAQTQINSLSNYSWYASDEPKTFSKKLQLSFVKHGDYGFPNYGTVLAGGSYSTSQDGGVFQLYFPYNEYYGGNAPKIRLGLYNNKGWSNWETFYTSANANKQDIDWKAKSLYVNENIGIGTTSPKSKLDLGSDYSDPSIYPNKITLCSGEENSYFGFGVSINDLDYFSRGNHRFYTEYNGTPGSEKMVIQSNGNVGIGTVSPGNWKLAVNGKVRAKEVKVETGWSDFVFNKEYELPSLQEVDNHIKEKGHLKDIPSAKEVEENGIFLGEMDAKLLQKIEELTLYTIQQEKKIENLTLYKIQQEKKIEQQYKEIKKLKLLNEKLLELQNRLEKLEQK